MNFFRKNLANMFTLANLFSGSIGVIHLIGGDYKTTAVCLIISLILDFFDGFVARLTKTSSNLGGQLDSLADMVSFGLLPGVAMYKMLQPFGTEILGLNLPFEIKYLGLFITVFSCLRLAIFNIDDEQKYFFKGLNTPSNTIFIFGMYYVLSEFGNYSFLRATPVFMVVVTVISSWLLVSPIRMIAMKFKSKTLKDNLPKIVLAAGALVILITFKTVGIPLVIIYYIIVSLIFQKQLK